MVFKNMFMDSTCCSGLCAVHSEQGEVHGRRKFVITKNHSKGLDRCHSRLSQDKIDREVTRIKL